MGSRVTRAGADMQAKPRAAESPVPEAAPRPAVSGRILVVDDQRSSVEMLAELLKDHGDEVLTALNGEQALERVRLDRPDLVVSDIVMPGIDGYELCRRLRA